MAKTLTINFKGKDLQASEEEVIALMQACENALGMKRSGSFVNLKKLSTSNMEGKEGEELSDC